MKFTALALLLTSLAVMAQDGDLTGKIMTLEGDPVGGVKLVLTHETEASFSEEVETKKNGSFFVRNIPVGPVTITASKEGYTDRTYEHTQEMSRMRQNYIMVPEGTTYETLGKQPTLGGILENTQGEGVPDAEIRIFSDDLPGWEAFVKTDASGNFEGPSLRGAWVTLHARKEGWRDQMYRFEQGKSDYKVRKFTMQTMEEYFAESGVDPASTEKTPEEKAIEFYNMAVDPYKNKDYEQAGMLIGKALENNPEMESALKMMVYINYNQNKYEEAITAADKLLAVLPDDVNVLQFAKESARLLKNDDLVTKYKAKLTELGVEEKETADSIYNKAVEAINAENDEEARELLNKVIEMDPKHFMAYREMANTYIREYEFEDAVKYLKLFLQNAPKNHPDRKDVVDLIATLTE